MSEKIPAPDTLLVHCDCCGHEIPVQSIDELGSWSKKPCPKCGQGEILNEAEWFVAKSTWPTWTSNPERKAEIKRRIYVRVKKGELHVTDSDFN